MGHFRHDLQKSTHLWSNLRLADKGRMVGLRMEVTFMHLQSKKISLQCAKQVGIVKLPRTMNALKRKMTREDRQHIKARFQRRQARRKVPKVTRQPLGGQWSWHFTIWLIHIDTWVVTTKWHSNFSTRWGFPSITKVYWTSKTKANGSKSWQGGRDLASTAMFTQDFCNHLLLCWENRLEPDPISFSEKPAKRRQSGSRTRWRC